MINPNLSPQAKEILASKIVVPIVGISASGKDTLIEYLTSNFGNYGQANGFTTRAKRPQEGPNVYREWLPNINIEQLMAEQDVQKELVQYYQHPTTFDVYGTQVIDYGADYNLIAAQSSTVNEFRNIGFKNTITIVVVVPPDQWEERFREREIQQPESVAKRIKEGIESLEWALGQSGIHWVNNLDGQVSVAALKIKEIAESENVIVDNQTYYVEKEVARSLLEHLRSKQ